MYEVNPQANQSEGLIVRFLKKQASPEEMERLRLWLSESTTHQRLFDEVCDVWFASTQVQRKQEYDPQKGWENTGIDKISKKQRTVEKEIAPVRFLIRWHWIAAIFILAFIAGSLVTFLAGTNFSKTRDSLYTEHYVPYGSKSVVTLPDGTRVWINSGSRLRYSQKFNSTDRQVTLEGEAYFDVYKNAKKPFLVKTSGITVKVIGTAFNVKAYPDEKTIETTVERGLVQVFSNSSSQKAGEKVFLHPKEKATYVKGQLAMDTEKETVQTISETRRQKHEPVRKGPLIVHTDVVTKFTTSWKDTRWIIEREELQDLAVKIERRYNVKVDFADTKLRSFIFSGILDDESLEQVLEVIKLSAPVNYTLKQKKIIFYENRSFINKELTH